MAGERFMRAGITEFFQVPTIASAALVPTAAEVNAGTKVTTTLAQVTGFSFANKPIMVPDMATTFTAQIPGRDEADSSEIEFYQLRTTDAIRTAAPKGTIGYMVIFFDGIAGATPAAGDKADVWPMQIASNAKMYTADSEPAKYKVVYSITKSPGIEKTLT